MASLEKEQLYARLDVLKKEINYHNHRYYVLDDPVISDFEYDRLLQELLRIEEEHPEWITTDSPSQRAGGVPLDRFIKVRHPSPILSLSNAFDRDGIIAWYDRLVKIDERVESTSFVVEPKIDGLTVVLHYRNGLFIQGATRGDGEIGEDVTANLRTIKSLPLNIPVSSDNTVPPYLVVRGEVFIPLPEFDKLNQKMAEAGAKTYLNPRNTAAGSLRQLDPSLTATRPLTLFVYAIVASDGDVPQTQWERLRYLAELGFPTPKATYCHDLHEAFDVYDKWNTERDNLNFEADGTVIKINDIRLADDLGVVGKDPRGAIAFKFPAREVTTILQDIGVNVGRTGVLTPYAIFEPVEIGGVIVRQATLHNFDYIAEKDIRICDRVAIKRAGDVIPYVIGPIEAYRDGSEQIYIPPTECPICKQPVFHQEGEVAWFCINDECPAKLIRNIEHFVSRGAMEIVGLGIKIVEQLVEQKLIHDIADLYTIKKVDLLNLEGFAEKKADNLITAIQASKGQSLQRLIFALGIDGVGEVVAGDLADDYHNLDQLSIADVDSLQTVEGIGPNIAQSIFKWFSSETNQHVLSKLRSAGVWPVTQSEKTPEAKQIFNGLTFVITGTLSSYTRESIKNQIQSLGGKVADSVSKNTSYVLVGENPGSKLVKANDLKIKVINEQEFEELIARANH